MKNTISQKELRFVILKLREDGLDGNEFDATLTQYILETYLGVNYANPTEVVEKIPFYGTHRINELSPSDREQAKKYWRERIWESDF